MNIGSRIMTMRRHVPDLPPTLPACPNPTGITPSSMGTLTAGTYLFYVTQTNPYGETLPCPTEQTVTVGSNGSFAFSVTQYPGVTGVNVYMTLVGGASGTEIAVQNSTASASIAVTAFPTVAATPPTSNSAYMPDADGGFISAANVFSWLSDGLNKISYAVNGLLDYCGVPTMVGQPLYVIPGQWLNITDVWYGGYWIQGGQRQYFYRRTPIQSSVLASVSISMQTDRQVMELFYQPNRSAGVTTTTSLLTATSNGVGVANTGAFLLAFGFAQLGAGSSIEIVAYSSLSGGIMGGLIRGMGNTIPQLWPLGTTVTELPLFWCGKRIFNTVYMPGQSNLSIPVPSGWETIIDTYMLAQAKKKEQDLASWEKLEKSAMDMAQQWMLGNRGVASKVQVGGSFDLIEYSWTPAGGLIIPAVFPMIYIDKMLNAHYAVSGGIGRWLLCSFMCLSILGLQRFAMSVKQRMFNGERSIIEVFLDILKELHATNGLWSCVSKIFSLNSRWSKSVLKLIGRSENDFGFGVTEESENCLMLATEVHSTSQRQPKFMRQWVVSLGGKSVLKCPRNYAMLGRQYARERSALLSKLRRYVRHSWFSLLIQLQENVIDRVFLNGMPNRRMNYEAVVPMLVGLNCVSIIHPRGNLRDLRRIGILCLLKSANDLFNFVLRQAEKSKPKKNVNGTPESIGSV